MKFMCLVYNDDGLLEAMPEAEFWSFSDAHVAVDEELRRSGHSLVAEALQPARTAKTVRVRGGKTHITDGPYAEAKEVVGGIYLIEANDMDEAVAIAARIPSASVTGIEVRPVWHFANTASGPAATRRRPKPAGAARKARERKFVRCSWGNARAGRRF